jgi:SAM-dependent methyltransferase
LIDPMSSTAKNRRFWNSGSDDYQTTHGGVLRETALAWGVWRIPESQLQVLGETRGRRVLELGCGAAQWAHALRALGADVVGIDLSEQQLAHARRATFSNDAGAHLVQGDAERLPFADASFDIVFCDHGAIVFAAPHPTVTEAARVLRPGGIGALCMSTPLRDICFDPAAERVGPQLVSDYFGLSVIEDEGSTEYQLPYGEWIRLFRGAGLVVEDLVELQAPQGATTTYADFVPAEWAHRWPAEHIWKVRKAGKQEL